MQMATLEGPMRTTTFFGEQVGAREFLTRSRCTCMIDQMCLEHSCFLDDPGDEMTFDQWDGSWPFPLLTRTVTPGAAPGERAMGDEVIAMLPNQCMGCQAGWPMLPGRDDVHVDRVLDRAEDWRFGMERVACTRHLYDTPRDTLQACPMPTSAPPSR